ncbi:MAG: helix-turn-helix domain-containing protein [Chloroflexi bacterium]|nr:helix-turn-helix domain-containing protein [Chloroflexota bacterium]
MNGRNGERPKRSSGELYDLIWAAALPPIMDERDNRAAAVTPVVARMVLLAMASFTNPNRDQVLGPAMTWQCFAAVATIAERADVSERQVQRVLRALEREGYIELIYQARRPGRPRKNQAPGQGRPNTWCLRPDLWPTRALQNRTGVVAISGGDAEIGPVPAEVASRPVDFPGNSTGTGPTGRENPTGVVTRTRSTYEPIREGNSGNKPALANARADTTNGARTHGSISGASDHERSAVQMALPGQAAVALSEIKQPSTNAEVSTDPLAVGRRIWGAARDQLFRAGLDRALEVRLRNTGTAGYDAVRGVLTLDGDLVAEDLEPGSVVLTAVATAAGRQLQVRNNAADRHARFEERLTPEDRALLQELERQRLTQGDGVDVTAVETEPNSPPANPRNDATAEMDHTNAAEVDGGDSAAQRRKRRKKELVA